MQKNGCVRKSQTLECSFDQNLNKSASARSAMYKLLLVSALYTRPTRIFASCWVLQPDVAI